MIFIGLLGKTPGQYTADWSTSMIFIGLLGKTPGQYINNGSNSQKSN
jgi:inosine/xanthosine triphosphate pyrophosphatase family protein